MIAVTLLPMKLESRTRMKLAAVDLDGTLLGPDGQVSEENRQAVQRLQNAGVQVMLASGRHYQNMQGFAGQLPGVQWLVSCQGGELSDTARKVVLNREFLPAISVRKTLELGRSLGLSSVAYTIDGVYTGPDVDAGLEFYTNLAGIPPHQVPIGKFLEQPIFKVIWIGEEAADIDRAHGRLNGLATAVQPVRTHQRLLEFMPVGISKASALKIMASRLDLTPAEVITFGDGDNDVSMFAWAGVSVAMPHGWPAAIRQATHVAPEGPAESAFARGVDRLFKEGIL